MGKVIKLSPSNGLTMRQSKRGVYYDYLTWRKGNGYKTWLKKQWAKQKGLCFYCDTSLVGRQHNVDHVLAISKGGQNRAKNFVLACPDCNREKGSKRIGRPVRSKANKLYRKGV